MPLSTPVVLLIFNRPDLTEIVFEAVRQAKPKKLLVVADGPRFPEEAQKCEKARSVIQKIDWECELLMNFSEVNLGCKQRVSSGLNWVFSEVEEAIILEDDCLPAPSFFDFCQTLLERYRNDERIMMISGDNFQPLGSTEMEYSYYFSKYVHIWGWASWRRAWQYYDVNMKTWPEYKKANMIASVCANPYEQKYWIDVFDRVFEGAVNTWDYQWLYACWFQNGLSILPKVNLVSNLGFRSDATHTVGESLWSQWPTGNIWEITHPPFIVKNRDLDEYTFDYVIGGRQLKQRANIFYRLAKRILNLYIKLTNWSKS